MASSSFPTAQPRGSAPAPRTDLLLPTSFARQTPVAATRPRRLAAHRSCAGNAAGNAAYRRHFSIDMFDRTKHGWTKTGYCEDAPARWKRRRCSDITAPICLADAYARSQKRPWPLSEGGPVNAAGSSNHTKTGRAGSKNRFIQPPRLADLPAVSIAATTQAGRCRSHPAPASTARIPGAEVHSQRPHALTIPPFTPDSDLRCRVSGFRTDGGT